MSYGLMLAGLAVLFLMFGLAIVKSGLLPAWVGWVCFPLGLCAVMPPVGFIAFLGAALWVLVVSVAMWLRPRSAEGAVPTVGALGSGRRVAAEI